MVSNAVIIDGNVIETGYYDVGNSGYNYAMTLNGYQGNHFNSRAEFIVVNNIVTANHNISIDILGPNIKIKDNVFRNIQSSTSNRFIQYQTGSSVDIRNNKFYRESSTINCYIYVHSTVPYITDNYFDSPTIDGTSELVIDGDTATLLAGLVDRNVNQTYYRYVDLNGHLITDVFASGSINMAPFTGGNFTLLNNSPSVDTPAVIGRTVLSKYFPVGTVILGSLFTYYCNSSDLTTSIDTAGTGSSGQTTFALEMVKTLDLDTDVVNKTGFGVTNVAGNWGSAVGAQTSNTYPTIPYSNLALNNKQYLSLNTSSTSALKVTRNSDIEIVFQVIAPLLATTYISFGCSLIVKGRYNP